MKKNLLLLLGICMVGSIYAQVGVNTTNPLVGLHVVPFSTNGSTAEGIIAPNLTRAQLILKDARYTASHKGSFVYITAIDGTVTAKTSKITTIGYYYFDGTEWKHFNDKIQTADNGLTVSSTAHVQLGGDLVKNTTIDTKTNTLTISNTGGTNTGLKLTSGGPAAGKVLTSDPTGNASWASPGFSVFQIIPYHTETINFSNVTALYDMSTFMIDFTPHGYGTYSITLGINVRFSTLTIPVDYCIVQLVPGNNKNLWGSSTLRFPGAYEAYAIKDRYISDNGSYRIYFSQNITLNATTGTKAYLVYSFRFTNASSGTVTLHIGQNLSGSGASPQISGGSFVKIN